MTGMCCGWPSLSSLKSEITLKTAVFTLRLKVTQLWWFVPSNFFICSDIFFGFTVHIHLCARLYLTSDWTDGCHDPTPAHLHMLNDNKILLVQDKKHRLGMKSSSHISAKFAASLCLCGCCCSVFCFGLCCWQWMNEWCTDSDVILLSGEKTLMISELSVHTAVTSPGIRYTPGWRPHRAVARIWGQTHQFVFTKQLQVIKYNINIFTQSKGRTQP